MSRQNGPKIHQPLGKFSESLPYPWVLAPAETTKMSFPSSTHHSYTTDSEGLRRCSVETNATSTSDFLAAVATEPPRIEDYKGYLAQSVHWPLPQCRAIEEPSDELPSPENLVEASRMPVRDAHGNQLTFRDLYMDGNHVGERRLILFIRHWYCRVCLSISFHAHVACSPRNQFSS